MVTLIYNTLIQEFAPKSSMQDSLGLVLLETVARMFAAVTQDLILVIHHDTLVFMHKILLSSLPCPCT